MRGCVALENRMSPMNRFLRLACTAAAALLLAACAGSHSLKSLEPGTPQAEVRRALGEPTGQYPGPNGTHRLEYATGPGGLHTYMVDIDAEGRMTRWQQVMDRVHFDTIRVGMSREELLYRIGRPAETSGLPYQNRTVFSYRFEEPFCPWFHVKLNPRGEVVETGYLRTECAGEDR